MTVEEIKEIAEKYSMDYEKVCIRTQEVPFELGEMTPVHYVNELIGLHVRTYFFITSLS